MKSLAERDIEFVWHPFTHQKNIEIPIGIVKGDGSYLIAENGDRFLDAVSSWWVNVHGHANTYIAEKVSEQLKTLEHVIFAGFTHEPAVKLAERLLQHLPENFSKVFYSDNGSTAVEVGMKMALQYFYNRNVERRAILAFEDAYHGDTFGAMAAGDRSVFTQAFHPMLFDVCRIPLPVAGRENESLVIFEKFMKEKNPAAFVFEPLILGAGGMLMYDAAPLDKMIAICKEYNVITIADEVMTGFYRSGKIFATDYLKNKPDIICLSKGITGGTMAMGVTVCTSEIHNAFLSDDKTHTFYHGHSYTANPLACAAANASLDLLEKTYCQNNINMICKKQKSFVAEIKNHPFLTDARCTGTIAAFEIRSGEETSYLNNIRDRAYNFFLERKIILRPLGNVIYILPPYCFTQKQLEEVHNAVRDFLNQL